MRKSSISRETSETRVFAEVNLDGTGNADISTGVGFFDHMLEAMCRFGMIDLTLKCEGDLNVDAHHTVEDTGICVGRALRQAFGSKAGIRRVDHAYFPMDESIAFAALDVSNRPLLRLDTPLPDAMVGGMPAQLAEEFFRAFCAEAGITLHLNVTGRNPHHMVEALFKAFGRALDGAKSIDPRAPGVVQSTKGIL